MGKRKRPRKSKSSKFIPVCDECHGTGTVGYDTDNYPLVTCPVCKGSGYPVGYRKE